MKRIFGITLCIVILCSCLIVPSFASSNESLFIPVIDHAPNVSELHTYGVALFNQKVSTSAGYHDVYYIATGNVLAFASYGDTYLNANYYVSDDLVTVYYSSFNTSGVESIGSFTFTTANMQNGLYYKYSSFNAANQYTSISNLVNIVTDLDDAINFASNVFFGTLINHVDVPAGNVAYIKTNSSTVLDLTTTFVQYSQLFSDSWANITQKVTWTPSLPVGTVTFPLSGMSTLAWTKTGNTNILGQTQNASASYQTVANQYFVIYNPLYQQYGQGDNYDMNGTIHVNGDMIEVKVYPLSGSVVTGQGLVSNSDSDYSDYFELQDDGNGGFEWVDQSGNVSSGPQTGGTSLLPQEATIQTLAAQILQIITKLGQSIANIFNVGHQAIVTLVGHASEFVSHFQSLYTWLPADIFAVLSSAIILAITIGIIKVFI